MKPKVKNDIDVTETINIELEHSVAKLLAENEQLHKEKEHLKQTYKDLFDSIKRTRVQTKDQNDSLMAQLNNKSNENVDVLDQIQKKGTAFKSERLKISKERFASQVDVSNDFSKPVTTHYLPKRREYAHAKPHYMIAPSSSRNVSLMPIMIHVNNVLNNQLTSKVPSNKTTKRYIPVEQTSFAKKPERQIPKRHKSSIKKTSVVHEKTMTPRSCLRWKPTGKLFKTVGLKWIPTRKIFTSSTKKVESDPPNGSKEDITNQCESEQALDVSAGTLLSTGLVPQGQKASDYDNSDPVPPRQNVVPTAEKTDSSQQGLEFLFSPLLEEYYTPTYGQAEENNNDQASNASFQEAEFINPFCTRVQETGSGYQQKDRKPSQNDKTEHGMEKTVQNQGQSPKMPKSESIL
ncbi:hypothetical protein Tco_0393757 [Tanacetum coccineum]